MKGPLLKVSGHDQIGPLKPDSHSGTDMGWRMKEKERKMKEHAKSELYAQVELQQWTNELIVSFSQTFVGFIFSKCQVFMLCFVICNDKWRENEEYTHR